MLREIRQEQNDSTTRSDSYRIQRTQSEAGDVAQLVRCMPSMQGTLGSVTSTRNLYMGAHPTNPGTRKAETEAHEEKAHLSCIVHGHGWPETCL